MFSILRVVAAVISIYKYIYKYKHTEKIVSTKLMYFILYKL